MPRISPISTAERPDAIRRRISRSRVLISAATLEPVHRVLDDRSGDAAVNVLLAARQRPDRRDQLVGVGTLDHVSRRAGEERLAHRLGLAVHRQDQDPQRRMPLEEPPDERDAIRIREREVEQEDVRHAGVEHPECARGVRRFADDLEVGLLAKHHAEALANEVDPRPGQP